MKNVLSLTFFLFLINVCCAQNTDELRLIHRIDSLVNESIKNQRITSNEYIIHSTVSKCLVLEKKKTEYFVHSLSLLRGYLSCKKLKVKDARKCFENDIYNHEIAAFVENNDRECVGAMLYFARFRDGYKNNQFLLPVFWYCDAEKVKYPVNDEVLFYLHDLASG